MKRPLFFSGLSVLCVLAVMPANAQLFNKLKDKVKQEADKAVDKVLDNGGNNNDVSAGNTTSEATTKLFKDAAQAYDFRAGTSAFFSDNFAEDSLGSMAAGWKTSGSGSVQAFPGEDGRWLSLKEFTSYKLKSDKPLPQNFTIEFDIVTHSNTSAGDLEALSFGFAHDNNISDYISDAYNDGAITATQIHYWNKEINNSSSDTKINNSIQFPLAQYAIGKMHVAIAVNGNDMRVYLDKVKVLDTEMFLNSSKKQILLYQHIHKAGQWRKNRDRQFQHCRFVKNSSV